MSWRRCAAILAASVYAAPASGQPPEPVGHVLWAIGQVERVGADAKVSTLAKGDPVFEGDVIRSGPGSSVQFIMSDEALLALRAESSLKLDRYSYHGREDGTERAMLELWKGGMRSISGMIGRTNKQNYELKNNGHMIGIRGTDHETYVTEAGTFNRVTLGGTYLQSHGGRVDLAPGEVGFASKQAGSVPTRLGRTPEFMHLAALSRGNSGPQPRGTAPSDERRLTAGSSTLELPAAPPVLPAQPLTENIRQKAGSSGGRCDGLCVDPLKQRGRSR